MYTLIEIYNLEWESEPTYMKVLGVFNDKKEGIKALNKARVEYFEDWDNVSEDDIPGMKIIKGIPRFHYEDEDACYNLILMKENIEFSTKQKYN